MLLVKDFSLGANIADIVNRRMGYGYVDIANGKIANIHIGGPARQDMPWLMPGFTDAHIHIESSMLTPPAFARIAVRHGTVATVSDPHEIANVCGMEGVRYMVELGRKSGFRFFFGAPSCVPATPFETAGAELTADDIAQLFREGSARYLSEMMNFPAVLDGSPLVMDKIKVAQQAGLPVDGHAPGLRGDDARRYAAAGISTDHECTTLEEALDKIAAGMTIIIREGSAAKNYDALHTLIGSHPGKVMFCSDDKHPDDLLRGHIDKLVTRSLALGYDLMNVLTMACVTPVKHYRLPVGLLQKGDPADMILVNSLDTFHIRSTWIDGVQVFDGSDVHLPAVDIPVINSFGIDPVKAEQLLLHLNEGSAKVIVAIDGAIVTGQKEAQVSAGPFEGDVARDLLKIAVINRYNEAPAAIAIIHGFGLKHGAIASSVAHDSHNIVAVGANDDDLAACINQVISHRGGIAASWNGHHRILPLEVGGLMSTADGETTGRRYEEIDLFVKKELGSTLSAPFMTLSFMALLVIPSLKLGDRGLFDGERFEFVSL